MSQIISIMIKEIKLLLRDPGGLIMLFILPASFIFVLSIALQNTFSSLDSRDKIDVLVINQDQGTAGQKMVDGIIKTNFFNVITHYKGKQLSLEQSRLLVDQGRYKIIIHIPENTSLALDFKTNEMINIIIDPVLSSEFAANITHAIQDYVFISIIENITLISRNIYHEINLNRISDIQKQIQNALEKKKELARQLAEIRQTQLDEQTQKVFADLSQANIDELDQLISSLNKQLAGYKARSEPGQSKQFYFSDQSAGLRVKQTFYSRDGTELFPNSVQQNVPGWTIFALFWIVQIIAINMITERQSGAYKRLLLSPLTDLQFTIGKIIPFILVNLVQALLMFSIGIFVLPLFGVAGLVIHNLTGLILLTLAVSLTAISLGLLIASMTRSLFFAASASASFVILMTVLGGIMVPKFIMPRIMQKMSYFVPHGWALDGYLNLIVKNYKTSQIISNVLILMLFTLFFFILAILLNKKFKRGL